MDDEARPRQPLPSEDTGDRQEVPASGLTDDYLVAREEGVPYRPATERVVTETRLEQGGPDEAGVPPHAGDRLSPTARGAEIRDETLVERCVDELRRSELPAGDHLRLAAQGHTVYLRGEVESVDVLDEIISLLAGIDGAEHVVDETSVSGV